MISIQKNYLPTNQQLKTPIVIAVIALIAITTFAILGALCCCYLRKSQPASIPPEPPRPDDKKTLPKTIQNLDEIIQDDKNYPSLKYLNNPNQDQQPTYYQIYTNLRQYWEKYSKKQITEKTFLAYAQSANKQVERHMTFMSFVPKVYKDDNNEIVMTTEEVKELAKKQEKKEIDPAYYNSLNVLRANRLKKIRDLHKDYVFGKQQTLYRGVLKSHIYNLINYRAQVKASFAAELASRQPDYITACISEDGVFTEEAAIENAKKQGIKIIDGFKRFRQAYCNTICQCIEEKITYDQALSQASNHKFNYYNSLYRSTCVYQLP